MAGNAEDHKDEGEGKGKGPAVATFSGEDYSGKPSIKTVCTECKKEMDCDMDDMDLHIPCRHCTDLFLASEKASPPSDNSLINQSSPPYDNPFNYSDGTHYQPSSSSLKERRSPWVIGEQPLSLNPDAALVNNNQLRTDSPRLWNFKLFKNLSYSSSDRAHPMPWMTGKPSRQFQPSFTNLHSALVNRQLPVNYNVQGQFRMSQPSSSNPSSALVNNNQLRTGFQSAGELLENLSYSSSDRAHPMPWMTGEPSRQFQPSFPNLNSALNNMQIPVNYNVQGKQPESSIRTNPFQSAAASSLLPPDTQSVSPRHRKLDPSSHQSPTQDHTDPPQDFTSTGIEMAESKPSRKPVFAKVCQLRPGASGFTLTVKFVCTKKVKGRDQTRVAECLVGDETAMIIFIARKEQVDLMKEGATLTLHNVKIELFNRSMRLAVDEFGRVEVAEPASFTVNEDINMSLPQHQMFYTD